MSSSPTLGTPTLGLALLREMEGEGFVHQIDGVVG